MGQDIHAFVVHEGDRDFAPVRIGRDYYLFSLLRADDGVAKVVPPLRGLPERLSPAVLGAHFDTERLSQHKCPPGASLAQTLTARFMNERYGRWEAERLHVITHTAPPKGGNSRTHVARVAIPGRRSRATLSNPDYHSIGWLTVPELERVAQAYRDTPDYGVHTAAWLEGHAPGRHFGWSHWRFYPQGSGPHLEPIPWWCEHADLPGPVVDDPQLLYRMMLYGMIGGGREHEELVAQTFEREGAVRFARWGVRNGTKGPHQRLEATIAAMRCLHDARLVFSFDN